MLSFIHIQVYDIVLYNIILQITESGKYERNYTKQERKKHTKKTNNKNITANTIDVTSNNFIVNPSSMILISFCKYELSN